MPLSPTLSPMWRGRMVTLDLENLPPQVRAILSTLTSAVQTREPAIRAKVEKLQTANPHFTSDQLARQLIRSTRRRVAATGALSGAAAVPPGFGTPIALGTVTTQALYALEQEIELVLGIAMIYGHELKGSDERVLEALVVVGITSGAVKLREDVLVAGGERLAVSLFRRLPTMIVDRGGGHVITRVLGRIAISGAGRGASPAIPLAVAISVGARLGYHVCTGLVRS